MRRLRTWGPGLLLVSPSIILVGIFVYGLIGVNISTSLAQTRDRINNKITNPGGLQNYFNLLGTERYQHALWNLLVLTVVFITGAMLFGLLWSVLLERGVAGEGFFRSIYLFPMAISFIAAGVAWRWLLSPAMGEQAIGLNQLFVKLGMPWLQSKWWSDPGPFNMAAMAIPAIWQLSGYIMALFLAGFRGISEDQREAGRVDGASEWQLYRYVLFPQVSPVALSALIILGHMSMKMFDLIYSIAGANSYTAEVPATYMWIQLFPQSNPTAAATNATIILAIVAVVVVPYLIYTSRTEREGR